MGDETTIISDVRSSPRRLRNHSYKESVGGNIADTQMKMSATLPNVEEEFEDDMQGQKLITKEDFQKKTTTQKLDSVAEAINKMYDKINSFETALEDKVKPTETAVFDPSQGLVSKVDHLLANEKDNEKAFQNIIEENIQLREEVDMLKGIVYKMSKQLDSASTKIDQLVVRSMEDNLVFTGILGDQPKKNPRKQLHEFLYNEMGLTDVRDIDILSVYRMRKPDKNKDRPIVAHCATDLRRYIMRNASILKHRMNGEGGKFYINQQLPDAISEQNREVREIIKQKKDREEDIPVSAKSKFAVKSGRVYINGQLQKKKITPPTVQEIFPDDDVQEKVNNIKLKHFHANPEEGSSFRVSVFKPENMVEVKHAYIKLFQKFPAADHISVACTINGEEAYHDDKEYGASHRMLRIIRQSPVDNIAIFMIRSHGGINLGPRRFTIIAELTKAALEKFTPENRDSLSPPRNSSKQKLHSSPSQVVQSDGNAGPD